MSKPEPRTLLHSRRNEKQLTPSNLIEHMKYHQCILTRIRILILIININNDHNTISSNNKH